ncbi:hypothetical protein AQUSIP_11510 [Aquicella siphonis]|uniref:Uncharacterized protein n=1 Tax=Aquicella siphonis TaxID=254247 RepID=A0A5E4PG77_9COXI|nr:hypothetical protein [Aquicella siphonis]VVC75854.1 hypothetical protein AQUSIP_11510 [Aquicella siphonis]
MPLLTSETTLVLWHETIKNAEIRCSISLTQELETYLISLLIRYTDRPEVAQQIFAKTFLEAMQQRERQRNACLQNVGDQCLLYAGLFPRQAQKKHVKINYFVDLGRSAYATISNTANDIYWSLALQFVTLMDVLQSIRETPDLMPLEAYDQWNELGSQRALSCLLGYTRGVPVKK